MVVYLTERVQETEVKKGFNQNRKCWKINGCVK